MTELKTKPDRCPICNSALPICSHCGKRLPCLSFHQWQGACADQSLAAMTAMPTKTSGGGWLT